MIAKTPQPPYYAVIFTSVRTEGDNGYSEMSDRMVELARQQDGFLGVESARNENGKSEILSGSLNKSIIIFSGFSIRMELPNPTEFFAPHKARANFTLAAFAAL
jgi:hypothetical protein